MEKHGTCQACGRNGYVKEKIISFTNVKCECCSIGFHQDKYHICMECIHKRVKGTTKISFTSGTYIVPLQLLYDNNKLSPTEMKKLIKSSSVVQRVEEE